MNHKQKITKILSFGNWTQDRFADLMGVANFTVRKWQRGRSQPRDRHAAVIDAIYAELVAPYTCELQTKADQLAEQLFTGQIAVLPDDNACRN